MERYSIDRAMVEAEELRLKVNSGEASNYQEAEDQLTINDQPAPGTEKLESLYGLDSQASFYETILARVHPIESSTGMGSYDREQITDILRKANVDLNPDNIRYSYLRNLTEKDWENIRNSVHPLITLYAAQNYYRKVDFARREPTKEQVAEVEKLPLIHGTSLEGLLKIMESGRLVGNRELFERGGLQSAIKSGKTFNTDREMGLDRFVHLDFARPHTHHQPQPEIVIVVNYSAIYQPGTFFTERDILDTKHDDLDDYLYGVSTPEYFSRTAALRITDTTISSQEYYENGSYRVDSKRNTIAKFADGQDAEQTNMGSASFSTWEVKVPQVDIAYIDRIVVRDEATYLFLKEKYGEQLDVVFEPNLRPGNYGALRVNTE